MVLWLALYTATARAPALLQACSAGSLHRLLAQERATRHCYRWQAGAPASACAGGPSGSSAAADPQLQELLSSREGLGLLLPEALPHQLPAFTLYAPAPPAPSDANTAAAPAGAAAPAANAAMAAGGAGGASAPPGDAGATIAAGAAAASSSGSSILEVRLVPAGTAELSQAQLRQLLGCSSALLAHMFARGSYCGGAAKLIATQAPAAPGKPAAASDGGEAPSPAAAAAAANDLETTAEAAAIEEAEPMPLEGTADGTKIANGTAGGSPAAAEAQVAPETPLAATVSSFAAVNPRAADTAGAAAEAAAETAPGAAGFTAVRPAAGTEAEAAAAAEQLVQRAVHRVLLLHDGRGLPRRKRPRPGEPGGEGLAACPPATDDAGFLLVPLLGGQCKPGSGSQVDWAAAQGIAASATFEGTVLDWLQQQEQQEQAGQPNAEEEDGADTAAGSSGTSTGLRRRGLAGRVLVTTYNNTAYLYR